MSDPVNHPTHYTSDPSGVECIQITRHRNFNIGNAIKYLWRAGIKDDHKHVEDLRKAVFYIHDEIARLSGGSRESASAPVFTAEEQEALLAGLRALPTALGSYSHAFVSSLTKKVANLTTKDDWQTSLRANKPRL